jgi:hypothetical protein
MRPQQTRGWQDVQKLNAGTEQYLLIKSDYIFCGIIKWRQLPASDVIMTGPRKNAPSGTRTPDQLIKSQLLYQLS